MKIVQLITHMEEVGGAQMHVGQLAVRLKEDGHDTWVVAGGATCEIQFVKKADIPVILLKDLKRRISFMSDVRSLRNLYFALKKLQPDLIACHSSKAGLLGRIAGWLLGIPVVFTAHGWAFTEGVPRNKRFIFSRLEKGAAILTKRIISVSEYDSRLALSQHIVPVRKMNTIRNGVPDIHLEHRAKPEGGPPVMMMVARFAPPKNQKDLLASLPMIRAHKWHLVLVGDGPTRKKTEEFAGSLGLEGKVHFAGNKADIACILRSAHIFVLISDYEGLPLSILEAMRGGLPIIASDVGGVKELVEDGLNGYLIRKGNRKDLADKLDRLLKDAELRKKMGQESRRLYEEHFTYEEMYRKTLSVYEEVSGILQARRRSL